MKQDEFSALTNDDIVANVLIFLLAGFETTTLTVAWALHLLALNQHEQELLAEEIDKNLIKDQVSMIDYEQQTSYK